MHRFLDATVASVLDVTLRLHWIDALCRCAPPVVVVVVSCLFAGGGKLALMSCTAALTSADATGQSLII